MSVQADSTPLPEVLMAVARATGAAVVGLDPGDDTRVTLCFERLPIAEGLARILRGRSFTVRLGSTGGEERLTRISLVETASTSELATRSAPSGLDVVEAIGTLARRAPDAEAHGALAHALQSDPDVEVRRAALHGLLARGFLTTDTLRRVVDEDADVTLRDEAARALEAFGP